MFVFRAQEDLDKHLGVTTSWQEFLSMLDNKKVSSEAAFNLHGSLYTLSTWLVSLKRTVCLSVCLSFFIYLCSSLCFHSELLSFFQFSFLTFFLSYVLIFCHRFSPSVFANIYYIVNDIFNNLFLSDHPGSVLW